MPTITGWRIKQLATMTSLGVDQMGTDKKTNLFWRLMKTEWPSADGHEDFVTEALASVLQADETLARHFLSSLAPIMVRDDEDVVVRTQSSYPATVAGESLIDLELRTESALLFVEIKIGTSLNIYLVESAVDEATTVIDQVKKYDLVLQNLDDSYLQKKSLIVIGQEPLKQSSEDLQHFYRDYLWWDIYRVIEEFCERRGKYRGSCDYRQHLAKEFLRFLEITNLSPPIKLIQNEFSIPDAVRALAEAIRDTGDFEKVTRAKNETGFKVVMAGRAFEVWFDNLPTVRAFEIGVGGLKAPELGEVFWNTDICGQIDLLREIVLGLPALERDDSAPITVEAALDQFTNRPAAQAILEAVLEEWPQSSNTGKGTSKTKEISCVAGRVSVRLSPYASQHVSINTRVKNKGLIEIARQLVSDVLDYSEPPEFQKQAQINVPIDLITSPNSLKYLMVVLRQLAGGVYI